MAGYVGVLVSDPWLQNQFTQVELRSLKSHVSVFSDQYLFFFLFQFWNSICGSPLLRITFYLFLGSLTRWRKRTEVWRSPTCLHKWRNWNTSERILLSKTESCFSEIPINVWMKTLISNYFFGYIFRAHAVEMLLDAVDSYPQMAFFEVVVWIILKRRHLIWKSA